MGTILAGLAAQGFPPPQIPDGDRDGITYERAPDGKRLNAQAARVVEIMRDGAWRTLSELATLTHAPEASISARLRDLRKERFGGHLVERRRRGEPAHGLFEYRLTIKPSAP